MGAALGCARRAAPPRLLSQVPYQDRRPPPERRPATQAAWAYLIGQCLRIRRLQRMWAHLGFHLKSLINRDLAKKLIKAYPKTL